MSAFFRAARAACILVLALTASACVSASMDRETRFTADSPTAFLVVASPPSHYASSADLRQVDMAGGRWVGRDITFNGSALFGDRVNNEQNETIWLTFREVPAGDYAVIALWTTDGIREARACLGPQGAPVYNLRPGTITILRTDHLFRNAPTGIAAFRPSDRRVLDRLEAVRGGWPHVQGEPVFAQEVATLDYEDGGIGWFSTCTPASTFTRREPGVRGPVKVIK
ncbi:hypothetical protein [Brevundimonas sp. GCM10030266]|uniref:hypothetical protein n=1 Tax=Brevundimonas sp. GCM10030266 TaxID=3273386 RepID=UPI00360F2740